jgi:hypothetical protein
VKLIEVKKEYSWLQWPVKLLNFESPRCHITAKFFGHAELDPSEVAKALEPVSSMAGRWGNFFQWEPDRFNDLVYVLKLTAMPYQLRATHECFRIFKDQFDPFQPHITVDQRYWLKVRDEKLTPDSEQMEVGELELCLGVL